jgi:PAS domain S-box-containing protein
LDVAKKYLHTIEQVIDDDKPEQIDYYMEAFGSRLWYNAKISPRKNVFGVVDGVTVLCRDVTRQKRTEETLKIAKDFYLTLLADFPSMIWKSNTTKKADYFNKTWLEFTGMDFNQEIHTDWVEKLHGSDVSNFLAVFLDAYKRKEAFQIEHRLKHHTGEYRWVINAGRPFYNLNGQFEGFIGSCYDISGRRKAEEMMHLQKSAMESALEGILIIEDNDADYPVIYANKELVRLTSADVEDIVGKGFLEVLGSSQSSSIQDDLLKALKNKDSFKGEFLRTKNLSDSEQQWYLLYMSPVKDKVDSTDHFIAVLSDITEAKQVEQTLREKNSQLRKTNEELDSFVYSTSHELRSPLMSVLGLLNLLETEIDHEDRSTYLSMIRESISKLDKIIHDIIDYSRNSRLDVINERIDFHSMIDKIIQDHKYYDNFDRVRFTFNVKECGPFLSDKKRIQTVINNFISNSLWFHDFDKVDPFVEISVRISSVNALITVKDNGSGIQEKHMAKIYDMFYRGTEKSKGSGIGLYIVKEIVDKLQGSIRVKSVPDKGTTFTVDLPNFINKNYKIVSLSETDSFNF